MYANQSRGGSKIIRFTQLIIFALTFICYFCIVQSSIAADTQIVASTNHYSACSYHIQSIQATKTEALKAPDQKSIWVDVKLPDYWEKRWRGYSGSVWYKIVWQRHCPTPNDDRQPAAMNISNINMAGEVFSNGEFIWKDHSLVEPLSRSWNKPRYYLLPVSNLKQNHNEILIHVVGIANQNPGLGYVNINNKQQILNQFERLVWKQRTVISINIIISLTLGILALAIWFFNRKDVAWGWFALSSFMWVLFCNNVLATTPYPFSDSLTLARVNLIFILIHGNASCLFAWRFMGSKFNKTEKLIHISTFFIILTLLFSPVSMLGYIFILCLIYAASMFLINCLFCQWLAYRSKKVEAKILAVVLLLFFFIAIHDLHYLITNSKSSFYAPYSSAIIMLALFVILAWRISKHLQHTKKFNHILKDTVEQVSFDLKLSLEKKYQLEIENMRLQERLNLSHELHDGLGGSLVRSMILVDKNEKLDKTHFLSILKLLRSDLRQIIDTGANVDMEPPATPVLWGAPLRHRFVQIFEEIDIESDWIFPEKWEQLPTTQQCLTLARVAEEALTNVIKHSHANHVAIILEENSNHQLVLTIRDNGVGFDPTTVQEGLHVGLQSMQARINRLGGEFDISSNAGETILRVIV